MPRGRPRKYQNAEEAAEAHRQRTLARYHRDIENGTKVVPKRNTLSFRFQFKDKKEWTEKDIQSVEEILKELSDIMNLEYTQFKTGRKPKNAVVNSDSNSEDTA